MKDKAFISMNLLRQKAEEQIVQQPLETNLNMSAIDVMKLSHELSVHQIELEMQNEELMIRNQKIEKQAADLLLANKKLTQQNKEMNEKTMEILKKSKGLAEFNSFYIGKELEIIQLKREVNDLLVQAGSKMKYLIS